MKLFELFRHEEWTIGLVRQPMAEIVRNGISEPIDWLPMPEPWTFRADPCLAVDEQGRMHLYCEAIDLREGRGEIHHAILDPEHPKQTHFTPVVVEKTHLSYPQVFRNDDDGWWMAVENWEGGGLALYHADHLGDPWIKRSTVMPERPVVDGTLFRKDDLWWLFCTFQDDLPNSRLHTFYADSLDGPWQPHGLNPIKDDSSGARPGGSLFEVDGKLIRPAQDCSGTYGGALALHHVTLLTSNQFAEQTLRVLTPMPGRYRRGLHTLTGAGDVTVIDAKRWRYHLLEPVRKLMAARKRRLRME